MPDLSQVTPPQWFTSAIGLFVLAIVWQFISVAVREIGGRIFAPKHRRIGNRGNDDAHGIVERDAWTDRLINALNVNASVNKEVAASLAVMVSRQDVILESFKLSQLEQRETNLKIDRLTYNLAPHTEAG